MTIAASNYHNIVRKADGSIWAWGRNEFGAVGVGNFNTTVTIPTHVVLP